MARRFRKKENFHTLSEINLMPLLDLAFSLLIIFMITTPLLEQSIPLDLPAESQKVQAEEKEDLKFQVISVNKDGQIYWGTEPVSFAVLDGFLQRLAESPNPPVLSIRADREVPYQKVIDVIDRIKSNQLSRIDLDTQVK